MIGWLIFAIFSVLADSVATHQLLQRGGTEVNPFTRWLGQRWRIGWMFLVLGIAALIPVPEDDLAVLFALIGVFSLVAAGWNVKQLRSR